MNWFRPRTMTKACGWALGLIAAPAFAQSVLLAQYEGKALPVVLARGTQPFVEDHGKLVSAEGSRFGFRPVEEYLPVFISVRNLKVRTTYVDVNSGEGEVNHRLELNAQLESPYRLEEVFIVLEMTSDDAGKTLFLLEIGTLEPREPKPLFVAAPLKFKLGNGHYQLHLFTHGAEVFHSEMPFDYRERKLDRMIAARVVDAPDRLPQPFVGPAPEYPPGLRKNKLAGSAVITLHVGLRGSVLDPVVKNASDPAFGEAALAAVRQWRFLPRIRDGHPVESKVDLPFTFSPSPNAARAP